MRLWITALWVIPVALVAAGFAAAWAAAVGAAERYNNVTISSVAEFDWASLASTIAEPLLLAGFLSVLVVLAVHALRWQARPE